MLMSIKFLSMHYIQSGGSGRTRTTGLTLIRGALYQLSYASKVELEKGFEPL